MNAKILAIAGSIVGLGILGLGTPAANAGGLSVRVNLAAPFVQPVYIQPQVVYTQPLIVQQPVAQQVIVAQQVQPQQVVCQTPAPSVVYVQPEAVYAPAPAAVIYADPRFIERHDFHHDDRFFDGRFGGRH